MEKRMVLTADYMSRFSCIGSACEDTCCTGWQITIDKKTYDKYEVAPETELEALLLKNLRKLEPKGNKYHYAEILLDKNSSCPLLSEEKLCKIHKEKGEDYLSDLCVTYPRVSNIVDEQYEKALFLSCPEAARVVLLNPNGIVFREVEEPIEVRHLALNKLNTKESQPTSIQKSLFFELRGFSIKILQNKHYSLSDRLIILGLYFDDLNEIMKLNDLCRASELTASYDFSIKNGLLQNRLDDVHKDVKKQLLILRKLIDARLFAGVNEKRYLQCLMEALEGLKFTGSTLKEESISLYQETFEKYYLSFLYHYDYIIENYLVNYVFRNLFPAKREVFEEYKLLIIHYSLIKMHLIGMMSFYQEEFGLNHVIKVIQSFSKTVEHAPALLEKYLEILNQENPTLQDAIQLIKN